MQDYVGTPITRTVVEVNLEALKILYHAGAKTEDIDVSLYLLGACNSIISQG